MNIFSNEDLNIYLKSVREHRLITHEEEIELAKQIKLGSLKAKNQMINANLRLVLKIIKRYAGKGLKIEDLIQEGNLGLIRAAEKYDPSKNTKFSTYASFWIKQSLQRALNTKTRLVKVPYRKENLILQINKYLMEEEKSPKKEDIMERFNLTTAQYVKIIPYLEKEYSLDKKIEGSENSTLLNLYEDNSLNPESTLEQNSTLKHLNYILETKLNEKERYIIKKRYNLDNSDKKSTLKDISTELGISSETVRQIEKRVLKKLREELYQ
ncbi:RNA polymerase sigma factor RpoD/SigA [Borrelia recurrentis]|uniref:RNA polymerase sigma factor n=1 Tax=Borrelia recurrentis (strain A1) TaxID=412418 RepID=B5RQA7_BORRA|nr:RNA polymerase sigma factor RpoD/SigA [Borrelia recurrentis]ACH94991.1 RNA polymerase sigma factor [Borrelia recurrentis A1]